MERNFPNKLSQRVWVLGNHFFHTYLVKGEGCALIEAGIATSADQVIQQTAVLGIEPEQVAYLVIMHAHFDHVTGVPRLKKAFPNMQVVASPYAARLLGKPHVVAGFYEEERPMVENLAAIGLPRPTAMDLSIVSGIGVDRIVEDGAVLNLGGICKLKVYAAPGHSPCSIAVMLEEDQILFPTDCAGYPLSMEYTWPVFFYSYQSYLDNLKKLITLKARVLAGPHELVVIGEQAVEEHLKQALAETIKLRDFIVAEFQSGKSAEIISDQLFHRVYINGIAHLGEPTIRGCADLLVRRSLETMGS
ncbi:MAG TPA: MBL fold metallo-hydrolase [Bacillota bacterium]|nr:MBL fold metallo-hydrolase [Bacillota bacterium]